MAVKLGTWTIDPDGQEWLFMGGQWSESSGLSHGGGNNGFIDWENIIESDRPGQGFDALGLDVPVDYSSFEQTEEVVVEEKKIIGIGPLKGSSPTLDNKTARYPSDSLIDDRSDYVFFQFGKYIPPFSKQNEKIKNEGESTVKNPSQRSYNASQELEHRPIPIPNGGEVGGIVLPMPQDLGNDIQQTWNGKQFSALGRAAIAGAAGGNFSQIGNRIKDFEGSITATVTSLQTALLNKIPGVGGNLDMNDITGSTQGIVLNPNAEVLYDTAELREIGMTFKMIPRSAEEAKIIKNIVYMFRYASVPAWGGGEDYGDGFGTKDIETKNNPSGKKKKVKTFGKDNFVRVPFLCKFSFMTGSEMNRNVQQFKPCAIRKVAVNYTSDGTYATYRGGEPVATELTLNFLESKILFKSDIAQGF